MKTLYLLMLSLFFTGCFIFQPNESPIIQPKLIKQSSLPPVKHSIYDNKFEFQCELVINKHGDVESVTLLNGSGDAEWDSLTSLSLLDWKFTPALMHGNPIKTIIRRKFIVMFEKPFLMYLAEIQFTDQKIADSVYKALINGADFAEMAVKYSFSTSRELDGYLGKSDINLFSKDISNALKNLEIGAFTKPLNYGTNFIILKRLPN
jgi:hypothetical protein